MADHHYIHWYEIDLIFPLANRKVQTMLLRDLHIMSSFELPMTEATDRIYVALSGLNRYGWSALPVAKATGYTLAPLRGLC